MAVLTGAVGGAFFLFVFPGGAISTLMHQVLKLPGPGAGIAAVTGPVALVFMLVAFRVVGRLGGALLASLGFSLAYALLMAIVARGNGGAGMFGSIWFVLAILVCGAVAECLLLLTRRLRPSLQCVIAAAGANVALLVFYWIVIFPRTKGWVSWSAVPSLLLVSLAGGIVAGVFGRAASMRIPRVAVPASER